MIRGVIERALDRGDIRNRARMHVYECALLALLWNAIAKSVHRAMRKEDSGRKSAVKSAEVLQKLQHKSVQCKHPHKRPTVTN